MERQKVATRWLCSLCGTKMLSRPNPKTTALYPSTSHNFKFDPTMHVMYQEKITAVRDGLPKFADGPMGWGKSGKIMEEGAGASSAQPASLKPIRGRRSLVQKAELKAETFQVNTSHHARYRNQPMQTSHLRQLYVTVHKVFFMTIHHSPLSGSTV